MLKKEDVLFMNSMSLMHQLRIDLAFGTSITYPGIVGNEYFMTKDISIQF